MTRARAARTGGGMEPTTALVVVDAEGGMELVACFCGLLLDPTIGGSACIIWLMTEFPLPPNMPPCHADFDDDDDFDGEACSWRDCR